MENRKFGLLGALAITITMFVAGCSNPCKKVDCINGECVDGTCNCTAGYEGTDCGSAFNAKFDGSYSLLETCTVSGPAVAYAVIVSPKSGTIDQVKFTGLWEIPVTGIIAVIDADGTNFTIARQALNSTKDISATTGTISADGKTINLTYRIYDTGGSAIVDECPATLTR